MYGRRSSANAARSQSLSRRCADYRLIVTVELNLFRCSACFSAFDFGPIRALVCRGMPPRRRLSYRFKTGVSAPIAGRCFFADKDKAMNAYVTVGLTVLAGAALVEAALIPGVVIGGAAVLAPRFLSGTARRPRLRSNANIRRRGVKPAAPLPGLLAVKTLRLPTLGRLRIKQAIAKTITFRVIVTTLDFTTNYVVIGELGTAAGLSAFALVAGPVFYFVHEAAWNHYGPSSPAVAVPLSFAGPRDTKAPSARSAVFTINRAIAKTITYRTIATIMDFTATYVVVGDLATALGLTAFGFVAGPFVYLGHEMVWDHYGSSGALLERLPASAKTLPSDSVARDEL
jgi:uncharacterized membrane protein